MERPVSRSHRPSGGFGPGANRGQFLVRVADDADIGRGGAGDVRDLVRLRDGDADGSAEVGEVDLHGRADRRRVGSRGGVVEIRNEGGRHADDPA